jgi:hypothetical protein
MKLPTMSTPRGTIQLFPVLVGREAVAVVTHSRIALRYSEYLGARQCGL